MRFNEFNGSMHLVEIDHGVESVIIPDFYEDLEVTSVCSFEGTEVETVKLGANLLDLPDNMFYDCRFLKSIEIPDGIEEIPDGCFNGCCSLEKVVLPKSIKRIGRDAFFGCIKLKSLDMPNVTDVESDAFSESGLVSLELPRLEDLGVSAFKMCKSLESVELGTRITKIRPFTFTGCKSLKSIEIPKSVNRIGAHAFERCEVLEDIDVSGVGTIGNGVFNKCPKLEGADGLESRYDAGTDELNFNLGGSML